MGCRSTAHHRSKGRKKKVLITRELNPNHPFVKAVFPYSKSILTRSFIRQESLSPQLPEDYQWVFFSSPASVDIYLKQYGKKVLSEKMIACMGPGTAEAAKTAGLQEHFCGVGQPHEVAIQFAKAAGRSNRILFPISDQSRRTVQLNLPADQVVEITLYKTVHESIQLNDNFDVICFTSPSNVEAYLESGNELNEGHIVIAIGKTTALTLRSKGIEALIPPKPTLLDMGQLTVPFLLS